MPGAPELLACFTGHRPQHFAFGYDEDAPGCVSIKRALAAAVALATEEYGITGFITGMALGVDTWAGEAVVAARATNPGIRLVAAVPCPGQESQWPARSQERYRRLLAAADEVVLLSEEPYHPRLMMARNRYMVDRSRLLIAVYDGTPGGGTANAYAYARRQGLDVLRVLPPQDAASQARLRREGQPRLFPEE